MFYFHQIKDVEFIYDIYLGQAFLSTLYIDCCSTKRLRPSNDEAICIDRGVFVSSGNERIPGGGGYEGIEFEWVLAAAAAVVILIYRGPFAPSPFFEHQT